MENKDNKIELQLSFNEDQIKDKAVIDKQNNLIILKEGNTAVQFTASYPNKELDKAKVDAEDLRIQRNKLAEELQKDKVVLDASSKTMLKFYDVAVANNTSKNRTNYDAKRTGYEQKAAAYKKKYAAYQKLDSEYELKKARIEKLQKEQSEVLGNVKWLWHLAPRQINFDKTDFRTDLNRNGNIQSFLFGKVYEGGGMGWVEPFLENDAPHNKVPFGYLIAAKGEPKILTTRWREYTTTNDGVIINQKEKKFKEAVQLHIYTQSMYGQDLDIEFLDDNWEDESLAPYELTPAERTKSQKEKKAPKALAKYFRREVKTYPLLDDEKAFVNQIVSDFNHQVKGHQPVVQKCIVNLYLDELWRIEGGSALRVHAIVNGRPVDLLDKYANEEEYIWISETNTNATSPLTGNTIIEVGEIETNAGNFRPCKYTAINIKAGSADNQTVFNENVQTVDFTAQRKFNLVAGSDKAKQTVTLELEDVETKDDDCTANPKHKGHVINLTPLTTQQVQGKFYEPAKPGPSMIKPAEKKSLSLKHSFAMFGYINKADNDATKSATNIITHDDKSLVFDAVYNYDIVKNGKYDWERLWGYVWLPSVQVDTYTLSVQTCRWHHDLDFIVYPDIKWTVGFKIDFDGDKFKSFEEKFKQNNGRTTLNPFKRAQRYTEEMNARFSRGDYSQENLDAYRRSANRLQARQGSAGAGIRRVNPGAAQQSNAFDKVLKVLDTYEVSLKAEWNNSAEKIDVIDTIFKTIEDFILGFKTAVKFAKSVLDGECTARVAMDETKRLALVKRFTKSPIDYSLSAPSLAVAASWYYETMPPVDKSSTTWGAGITWAIQLSMAPLIGIEIKMDLFQMLSRKHPVAMAVYAASSLLQSLLDQDKPVIAIDLVIKGEITLDGKFKHNSVGGNVFSRGGKSATKEELLKGGASVSVSLEVRLHGELKVDFFYVSTIKGYIDAGVKGTAGFGIETAIGTDDMGMYWENSLKFDGMKLKGNFTVDVEVKKTDSKAKKKPEPLFDAGFEIGIDESSLSLGKCRF